MPVRIDESGALRTPSAGLRREHRGGPGGQGGALDAFYVVDSQVDDRTRASPTCASTSTRVAELDRRAGRAGARRRSALIAELVRRGLDDERRWDEIEAALGKLDEVGHDWDDDPAEWVRSQRRSDTDRVG